MAVRGVRGATTVENNQPEEVLLAAREMLENILKANPSLQKEDIVSAFFSVTPDLQSTFPAKAARLMGWTEVALMCYCEIAVPDSLCKCVRVLIHWNTDLPQSAVRHVYLKKAVSLRPDIVSPTLRENAPKLTPGFAL
jgi:chorismate mutase